MSSHTENGAGHGDFSHIRLICDGRFPHKVAQILPGEFYVSRTPTVVYTVVGSFFSACVTDPVARIGGMNHFIVPNANEGLDDEVKKSAETDRRDAMDRLVSEVIKQGGAKNRMEVKVFGGAALEEGMKTKAPNPFEWIVEYLKKENLRLLKSDIGDVYPRKIYFYTDTGRVLMKKITRMRNKTILIREEAYKKDCIEGVSPKNGIAP